jgi:hypothetical protein
MGNNELKDQRHVGTSRRWLLLIAVALIAGVGIALLMRRGSPAQPAGGALDGKLIVYVRPPERSSEPQPVETPGAAPVLAGGNMSLEVQFSQPALAYLVWLDCEGKVLPLYPWNTQTLEVLEIHPPPERRSAKLVYSPLLGGGWAFGEGQGTEIVLLLARRTPLPEEVKLADLIAPLPAETRQPAGEVALLAWKTGAGAVSVLRPAAPATEPQTLSADDPLGQLILRLSPHFELIRAARFPHASRMAAPGPARVE